MTNHSNCELTIPVVYVVVLVLGIAALLTWLAAHTDDASEFTEGNEEDGQGEIGEEERRTGESERGILCWRASEHSILAWPSQFHGSVGVEDEIRRDW